jgi:hypothetical protein
MENQNGKPLEHFSEITLAKSLLSIPGELR